MEGGWIKIHRKMRRHWIVGNPRYLQAWICMLMDVNWVQNKVVIGNQLIYLEPGQSCRSIGTWAKELPGKWTRKQVRGFFDLLESDHMIARKGTTKTTILTICNYNAYQFEGHAESPTEGQQRANKGPTKGHNIRSIKTGEEGEEYICASDDALPTDSDHDVPVTKTRKSAKKYSEQFQQWWAVYMDRYRASTPSKADAWKKWQKLSQYDQAKVVTHTPGYLDSTEFPYSPNRYLRERIFDEEIRTGRRPDGKPSDHLSMNEDQLRRSANDALFQMYPNLKDTGT